MGDSQPVKASQAAPQEALAVRLHRCPWCHEDVPAEGASVCEGCLARHHTACWEEGGHCAACSGVTALRATRPPLTERVIRDLLTTNGYGEGEQDRFFANRLDAGRCAWDDTPFGSCTEPAVEKAGLGPLCYCPQHARKVKRRVLSALLLGLIVSIALGVWIAMGI